MGMTRGAGHAGLDLWPVSVSRRPAQRARDLGRVVSHSLLI